jgi:hypothetical protein
MPVLKHVRCIQHLQHELPILIPPRDGSAQTQERRERLHLGRYLLRDKRRKVRMMLLEKFGKAIKVSERVLRPFDF